MQVTLLLPIRIDRSHRVSDLQRFLAIGLPSLNRFLSSDCVAELIVIAPPEDVNAIRKGLVGQTSFSVRVVDEAEMCPPVRRERGWYKQQILKLAAAELIKTPWYLTLDADVMCVRPVNAEFLFPDGRAIWQRESASQHPEWWAGSRAVLRSPGQFDAEDPVIGVTPALMHTESTRELLARLTALYPEAHWSTALTKMTSLDWTEYSLYWTHLLDVGKVNQLYSDSISTPYNEHSVWCSEQADALDAKILNEAFASDARHGFFVFQSRVSLPLEFVARLLRPRIGLSAALPFRMRVRLKLHELESAGRSVVRDLILRSRNLLQSKN